MDEQDTFTTRLNRLFKEKTKPDGSHYTQSDVIEAAHGVVDRVYLWKLLTGRAANPNLRIVQALAEFFGVDPNYFFESVRLPPEPVKPDPRQELHSALRAFGLDKDEQAAITAMVELLTKTKAKDQE